jgi:hypothetical protein
VTLALNANVFSNGGGQGTPVDRGSGFQAVFIARSVRAQSELET